MFQNGTKTHSVTQFGFLISSLLLKKIWHYLECLLVLSLSTYSNFESHKPVIFSYACQCSKLWLLYFYTKLYSCNKGRKTWSFKFLLISWFNVHIVKYTVDIISTKTRQDQFLFWGYLQNTKDRPEIMFSSIFFFNFRVKNTIYLIYFTLSGIYFSTCYLSLYYWPLSYRLKVNDW